MKSYTDEEVKQAYEIIESQNNLRSKIAPDSNSLINELTEKVCRELFNLPFTDHIAFFKNLKKATKERLITENKTFEGQYLSMKDQVAMIDEFIKTELS